MLEKYVLPSSSEEEGEESVRQTRIKEKQLTLQPNMSDHDFLVAVKRVRKWLDKDKIVKVHVKTKVQNAKASEEFAEKFKQHCYDGLAEGKEQFLIVKL